MPSCKSNPWICFLIPTMWNPLHNLYEKTIDDERERGIIVVRSTDPNTARYFRRYRKSRYLEFPASFVNFAHSSRCAGQSLRVVMRHPFRADATPRGGKSGLPRAVCRAKASMKRIRFQMQVREPHVTVRRRTASQKIYRPSAWSNPDADMLHRGERAG